MSLISLKLESAYIMMCGEPEFVTVYENFGFVTVIMFLGLGVNKDGTRIPIEVSPMERKKPRRLKFDGRTTSVRCEWFTMLSHILARICRQCRGAKLSPWFHQAY